jgi:hypothetical protein
MMRRVPTKNDKLQIMYGIRGEKNLTARIPDNLSGSRRKRTRTSSSPEPWRR